MMNMKPHYLEAIFPIQDGDNSRVNSQWGKCCVCQCFFSTSLHGLTLNRSLARNLVVLHPVAPFFNRRVYSSPLDDYTHAELYWALIHVGPTDDPPPLILFYFFVFCLLVLFYLIIFHYYYYFLPLGHRDWNGPLVAATCVMSGVAAG